ncbi:MAG: archaemetzincin [bacterium]
MNQSPSMEILRDYTAAYFAMEVKILPALNLNEGNVTTRINPFTGNRQILTGDVLAVLKRKLPADAFSFLAISMEDLYPDPSWNFVFGQASLKERIGVYSFARYDPAFYREERRKDYQKLLLKRSCKVLVHEMAHMFGLMHCIFFKCVLNGSNVIEIKFKEA